MSLYTSKGLIAKDIFNDKEISGSMIFLTVDFEQDGDSVQFLGYEELPVDEPELDFS